VSIQKQGDGRRTLLARDERSAQIRHAAAVAFARGGYAGTSMDDVAAEAGITKLIVYRHYASKDELYRAVLTGVAQRLREEIDRGLELVPGERRGFTIRAMLTVAREDPAAFRLLMVHASREPSFADVVQQFHEGALALAQSLVGRTIADPTMSVWVCQMFIDYHTHAVLQWLDLADPSRDEELIERTTAGLLALFSAWADPVSAPRPEVRR
jgi:AcrR family transcriptional regulator